MRWKLNQHSSDFWSFFWSCDSNNIVINDLTDLVSQIWIFIWNSTIYLLSFNKIPLLNRQLIKRNLWCLIQRKYWLRRGHLNILSWPLRSSLILYSLCLLISMMRILLILLILSILSLILIVNSLPSMSLVNTFSIIHLTLSILIGLNDL